MYFNNMGKISIVKKEVIDEYLNRKRNGNIIYCLKQGNSYFAKDEHYKTIDELNLIVAKYMLEGYEVFYNADNRANKKRSHKRKCWRFI